MSEIVTLELPDVLMESVRSVARQSQRPVEAVLLEWLARAADDMPVAFLPDEQVLALRDSQMSAADQEQLDALLAEQREGTLDAAGAARLAVLMQAYRRGMVRKAEALKVAVERGLQPALTTSDGT